MKIAAVSNKQKWEKKIFYSSERKEQHITKRWLYDFCRSLWQYRLKIEASDFLELSTRDRSHHGNSAMSRNDANKTRWQTFFWEAQCKASSSHRKLSWSVGTFWLESGLLNSLWRARSSAGFLWDRTQASPHPTPPATWEVVQQSWFCEFPVSKKVPYDDE